MIRTIIFVQHTEAEHHLTGVIGANHDFSLTERGKQQAYAIGQRLLSEEGNGFIMYASDMKRALQAAEQINRSFGLTPIVRAELRSVDEGEGNGKTQEWHDLHRKPYGDRFDPDYRPFEGAESDRDLWNRISTAFQEIMNSDAEKILVVSHGITVSFLQSMMMGYTLMDLPRFRFDHPAGGVSKYRIGEDGKVTAMYVNRMYG